jgi:ATP-binding cassette, subfamily C, bacterial LapB
VLQIVDRLIWLEAGKIMADGSKADVLKRMSGAAA